MKLIDIYIKSWGQVPISSHAGIFQWLVAMNVLIVVNLHSSEFILVGKVLKIRNESLVLEKIDANAEPSGKENIRFDKIRVISVYTDYLKSLELYPDSM